MSLLENLVHTAATSNSSPKILKEVASFFDEVIRTNRDTTLPLDTLAKYHEDHPGVDAFKHYAELYAAHEGIDQDTDLNQLYRDFSAYLISKPIVVIDDKPLTHTILQEIDPSLPEDKSVEFFRLIRPVVERVHYNQLADPLKFVESDAFHSTGQTCTLNEESRYDESYNKPEANKVYTADTFVQIMQEELLAR